MFECQLIKYINTVHFRIGINQKDLILVIDFDVYYQLVTISGQKHNFYCWT